MSQSIKIIEKNLDRSCLVGIIADSSVKNVIVWFVCLCKNLFAETLYNITYLIYPLTFKGLIARLDHFKIKNISFYLSECKPVNSLFVFFSRTTHSFFAEELHLLIMDERKETQIFTRVDCLWIKTNQAKWTLLKHI